MVARSQTGPWLLALALPLAILAAPEPPSKQPLITSVFPIAAEAGKPFEIAVRGKNLKGARMVWFAAGKSVSAAAEEDEVLRATVTLESRDGPQAFRVVTAAGVSNALSLTATGNPVAGVKRFDGVIAAPGDIVDYNVSAKAGEVMSFDVRSGFKGFDPVVTIAQRTGSWFDAGRVNPIAANDDPLYFPGLSTDAHLVHRFDKAGEYIVRVASFTGQGGPDHTFQLTITPGVTPTPVLHPKLAGTWEERQFTRQIPSTWMGQIADRGAPKAVEQTSVETFRATIEGGSAATPVFSPPGVIEGRIEKPGEAHTIQLKIDKPQDLVIEIETPEATMPRFNPIVRLSEPSGHEIVTNVYTKLNNNGLYMMKMIQAKTSFTLTAAGVYTMQIRDITTDRGGADFRYRVLVRPQIPHVGVLATGVDHINLKPGGTQTVTVTLDREEEFGGTVALTVENLPAGVTAIPAMEKPVERPPLPNGGRLERYTAKPQTASVLLVADESAPLSAEPVAIRVLARPIVAGQLRNPIPVTEIPLMVVAK